MAEETIYDQAGGGDDPLQKLYDVVHDKGLYTKTFDEFKSKYNNPQEQDKLFGIVAQQGLYTKGKDEFLKKYFLPTVPKFQLPTKPLSEQARKESTGTTAGVATIQDVQNLKKIETHADKFSKSVKASKDTLQKELQSNEDVVEKTIREGRYLQAKEQALTEYAQAPRSDMPQAASMIDANRLMPPETKAQDLPVTVEDIELKKQGIQANEAEARQHLANTAKYKPEKKAALEKAAYLADKATEIEQGGNPERIAKIYNNAEKIGEGKDYTYDIAAGGPVRRREGFFDSVITGIGERKKQLSGYSDVKNMTDAEAADYFDKKAASVDPDEPVPMATGAGEVGQMFGTEWASLLKGGVASAVVGRVSPQAAPFVSAALNAPEYYKRGYYSTFEQAYHQLKNEGKPKEEAIKIAREQAETEGKLDAAEGAVSSIVGARIGLKPLPKFNITGGLRKAVTNVLSKTAHYGGEAALEGTVDGLVAGYLQDRKNMAATERGIFRSEGEGIVENVKGELIFSLAMAGVTKVGSAAVDPKTYKTLLYQLTKEPEAAVDARLQEWVQEGRITEEDAKETKSAIQHEKQIQSQIPDNVTEEAREKIRDKIEDRNELQSKTEQLDEAFKPELKEKEKAINEEIVELSKDTVKPTEEQKLVKNALVSGDVKGPAKAYLEDVAKDPESVKGALMEIAEQAHDPESANQTIESFGQKLVDKAKELYPIENSNTIKAADGQEYANTPRMQKLVEQGNEIRGSLPSVPEGHTRLWRGNRPGETGQNPSFTNSLEGIALPFKEQYGGDLSYIDVPTVELSQYENKVGTAQGSEFILPENIAQNASTIRSDQGQIKEAGDAIKGGKNQGGENIQPSSEAAPIHAETQQQAGQEIVIETPEDLEREIAKAIAPESTQKVGVEQEPVVAKPEKQKAAPKPKKEKPALNKKEQEQAEYAYNNSYRFFKQKYPDVDVDEYNRLRSAKRQQGLPKLGEINKENNVRDRNEDTAQYTPQSILEKAKEFYKNDPLISRVIAFLEPIIKANPNIKIDTSFDWNEGQYEGQKITKQALGYSFPSGNLILNFDRISDYDTLYRTALHELVHAATRSEIETNKAFNEDLKKVLAEVRRAMKLPEGDSVVDALIRNKVISEDYDSRYGAANEHELLAEVFTNQKFSEFLKGLEYKGDNLLHRLFLAIAKFFSQKYKALVSAKEKIGVDNIADYLMGLTESVVSGQQDQAGGDALPLMRPKEREVLKNVIAKAQGKISDADIRGKLKQIAGLTDQEIDELLEEVVPAQPQQPSARSLTEEEIGSAPTEPKRKSAVRRFREKYFDRAKGLPDWILKLKDRAKGTAHLEVRQALQLVEKTRQTAKQIGFDDWDLFDKALRGQYYGSDLADLKALPPEMQVLAVQMRNKIDSLSRDLIINNYVTPEQALNIESNIGEYMTRSYRAFNEKEWSKKVPTQAREDAYRLLVQQRFDELHDPNDPDADIDAIIDQAKADAFRDLQSIIDGISDKYTAPKVSVQKGNDLGILKQRQDIPKEIREVLGEYTDPGVNFAMTVARIASLKSSAEYLTSVKTEGLGEIFFEADSRPPDASVEIKSEGSETWNPLNGLYTTPEIKAVFDETEVIRNKWVQLWLKGVGAIKWGKTVGSLVTQVKNFESNLGFAVMNGHYRAGKTSESFKFLKDKLFGGEKSQDQMIEKVIRLGIVDQSIGVRELKDMFATDNLDKVITNSTIQEKSILRKIGNTLGKPIQYLNKVYGASDDFWKVYGFLNEAESLSQATYGTSYKNLTEEQQSSVDVEASERVKNVYPTYDRVWEGAKSLSKGLPIFGNFLSFQAESIRVLLNTFNYALKDLKTPGRQLMGAQRLAGIGAYLGARTMILYTIAQMTGVGMAGILGMASDDDEEQKLKDINRFSPEFIRSGDKLSIDHGEGNYTVYDIGGLEPYGVWFKTQNAFTEGNDIVKNGGIGAAATELLSPFMEPEMSFKMGLNLYNNENDFGGRIYNPMDGLGDQTLDAMEFIIKKAKPSTIDLVQRIYSKENKTNEISSIFGGRGYDVDIAKNFSFKLKAAEELFDANRDAMNKVKYGSLSTPEQISEAENKFEERTNKVIKMLAEDYQAAIRLGTKIEKLDEVLDRKKFFQGYNKDVKNQIKSGVVEEEKQSSDEIKEWQP